MLDRGKQLGMIAALLFAVTLNREFCPRDPMPVGYQDSIAFQVYHRKIQHDYSAIAATILVDRKTNARIGWLVLDDSGHPYVVFRKGVDRSTYSAFKPNNVSFTPAASVSSPMMLTAPIPKSVKLDSCTLT